MSTRSGVICPGCRRAGKAFCFLQKRGWFFSLVEKRFFCVLVCTNLLAPGLPGPDPGRFLRVQKVTKDTPKGKGPFARSSPLGNPLSFGRPKRGLLPPFWIFPGEFDTPVENGNSCFSFGF